MNGLLKEQLCKLSPTGTLMGWSKNIHQATACLNDHPPRGSTPYAHFKGESIKRPRVLGVQRLQPQACLPRRALPGSAGLGLRLPHKEITLELESRHLVSMGLAVTIPQGYYGRMVPCNSLALRGVDIIAGVIDLNYLEGARVAIHYTGSQPLRCAQGDQIAQLITEWLGVPTIQEGDSLQLTQQPGGFRSTGRAVWVHDLTKPVQSEGEIIADGPGETHLVQIKGENVI
ncbi:deoxyuridine 5'-triphosphate nucleotidohydrolase-like [Dromaius novaehollandiae]|uniref:deoxyuridine 5'-triphosphate nucleotidohydrolase-like n=1 Tax=Dromaius novaehollandiae TaxID=8790 RepID=UPI00311FCC8A